jgi:hypothetical protein
MGLPDIKVPQCLYSRYTDSDEFSALSAEPALHSRNIPGTVRGRDTCRDNMRLGGIPLVSPQFELGTFQLEPRRLNHLCYRAFYPLHLYATSTFLGGAIKLRTDRPNAPIASAVKRQADGSSCGLVDVLMGLWFPRHANPVKVADRGFPQTRKLKNIKL